MSIAAIRLATRSLHEELETVLNIPSQVKTRAQYGRLLQLFLALYEPWEAELAGYASDFAARGVDLGARRRTNWLKKDLAALGLPELPVAGAGDLPDLSRASRAWGSLYVLEGSTLGGQVLTRLFEKELGLNASEMHFFQSYGADVGRMWKEFCLALETASGDPEAMREGAMESFEALMKWFRVHGVG